MNCASCQHWENHKTPHEHNGKTFTMEKYYSGWIDDPLPGDYGLCLEVYTNKAMCICDGEGISGQLITHESFYCSEYKPKTL